MKGDKQIIFEKKIFFRKLRHRFRSKNFRSKLSYFFKSVSLWAF